MAIGILQSTGSRCVISGALAGVEGWVHRGRVGHSGHLCSVQSACLYIFEQYGRVRAPPGSFRYSVEQAEAATAMASQGDRKPMLSSVSTWTCNPEAAWVAVMHERGMARHGWACQHALISPDVCFCGGCAAALKPHCAPQCQPYARQSRTPEEERP